MNEVPGLVELGSSQGGTYVQGASMPRRREYPGGDSAMMMIIEGHIEIGDPLREGDIQTKVGDPLTKEDTLIEDLLEEDIPIEMEDPLEEEDTQEEDPLMEIEDPLMVEDLLVMEDPWTSWWTRTTRPLRTPWTSETNSGANSPSDIRYICSREYL